MLAVLGSMIVTFFFRFLLAANPDQAANIDFKAGHSASAIAVDPVGCVTYAVVDSDLLETVNLKKQTTQGLFRVVGIDDAVAMNGVVYLASSYKGTVSAYDVHANKMEWTLSNLPGVRSLVVDGSWLILVVPGAAEVRRVSTADGSTTASRTMTGVPWATALVRGNLYVSLFQLDWVAELDATTCTSRPGSRRRAAPGSWWRREPRCGPIRPTRTRSLPLRRSTRSACDRHPEPVPGAWIQRHDIRHRRHREDTTVNGNDRLHAYRLPSRTANAIVVMANGNLVVSGPTRSCRRTVRSTS